MSGNGQETGLTEAITGQAPAITLKDQNPEQNVFFAAEAGSMTSVELAQPTATLLNLNSAAVILVFV
jgi:hypothetical protein